MMMIGPGAAERGGDGGRAARGEEKKGRRREGAGVRG
jgi:hypothetical protein